MMEGQENGLLMTRSLCLLPLLLKTFYFFSQSFFSRNEMNYVFKQILNIFNDLLA